MRLPQKVLVFALVVGFAVFVLKRGSTEDSSIAQHPVHVSVGNAVDEPRAQFFDRISSIAQSKSPADLSAPLTGWHTMEEKFRRAQSLRAFFYSAIQNPKDGGYFYAMQAMSVCADLDKAKIAGQSGTAQTATATLRMRCDFTEQDRDDGFRQFAAIRALNYKDDPLLKIMINSATAKGQDQAVSAFIAAIDTGNPSLIGSFVLPHVQSQIQSLGGDQSKANEVARFALDLIGCRLGADCGQNSTRALSLCAERGWCENGVTASLQSGLGAEYEKLNSLARDVVANIEKRAIGQMVAPNEKARQVKLSSERG
jgi:hypothetical protein